VQNIHDKQAQASIVVVDLRNYDPDKRLTNSDLQAIGDQAIHYRPSQSTLYRVIFIRPDGTIYDVNPLGFGPPSRADAPPRPPVAEPVFFPPIVIPPIL